MAKKDAKIFYCTECGNEYSKWQGQCNHCKNWNTIIEAPSLATKIKRTSDGGFNVTQKSKPLPLKEIKIDESHRISTGLKEFDRVLGGDGIVAGSIALLSGDPGIGKSTILLQSCDSLSKEGQVLYISGEESASQIKMRAERIGIKSENIRIYAENNMDEIEDQIIELQPSIVIVDSVQTMYKSDINGIAGGPSQVKEVAAIFTRIAKTMNIPIILVGHINKDGNIAGPMLLEHIVDTVLYFEGDKYASYRILRAIKNRFGPTNEIGVFEMNDIGFSEVTNPSGLFISEDEKSEPGCGITCIMEGTRPILAEVQALVSETAYSNPKRTSKGIDYNRLSLLTAVLEKKAGVRLNNQDIYINIVGGLETNEPSVDLSIVLAVASSLKDKPIKKGIVSIGEVSLTGEIRPVNNIDNRISECKKMGFEKVVIPFANKNKIKNQNNIEIIYVTNVREAIKNCLED